jgi:hypothetical protein
MAIFNFLIILRNHSWSHPIASHNAEKANMNISRNIRVFNASCSSNAEMKGETSVFRYRDKCNIIPKYPFKLLFLYNHSFRVLKLFRKLIWDVYFIRVFFSLISPTLLLYCSRDLPFEVFIHLLNIFWWLVEN